MYPVSDAFMAAIRDNTRRYRYEGKITTESGDVYKFENKDIVKGSGYITNQCCGDSEIELGTVYSAEFGISLYLDIERHSLDGAEISISFLLELADGSYEEVPLGVYDISEATREIKYVTIKAYDRMLRFEVNFKDQVSNGTAFQLLDYACRICGVELAHTEKEVSGWSNGKEVLGIYTDNDIETWRDVIYYVAQALGRFCTINREGKLELRGYGNEPIWTIPATQRYSSSFSDFVTRYTAVSSTNARTQIAEYYALDTDDGLTMNLGTNPMLQLGLDETRENIITNVLNEISLIDYVPFESSTIGNPAFDLGDIITFSGGHAEDGQITCITKYEYKVNGKHTLKCVGKDPRLSSAKSKNDKNISGLLSQIEAGKIAVHTYFNTSPFTIESTNVEVCSIEFASNDDTDAQFHASILMDVYADAVEKSVSGSTTVEIEPESEEGEKRSVDVEVPIKWTEDGKAVVTATYILNDSTLTTYIPIETFGSGRHIMNLYYPLSGLSSNSYNTFRVWLKVEDGYVKVDRGGSVCTISGQGLSSNNTWDGRIEVSDSVEPIGILGGISTVGANDTVVTELMNPSGHGLSDSMGLLKLGGFQLVGFDAKHAVNQIIVTETIETADIGEMAYNKELVSADVVFELKTEYSHPCREIESDSGRICIVTANTSRFARVDSLEVTGNE